jgi:DNA-binding transcriptional LysR family regulator
MNLSTSQIDAFLALAQTLQFSAAAERCHVSTSAFSQIISRLEEEMGARLFDRSTRHVALTPEGEVFAMGARRISSEVDAAVSELRARIAGRSGQVSIAATPSPCVSWLPNLMSRFRATYPDITLKLHDAISDRCFEMLMEGYADFGVTAQAGEGREFESAPLFDEPYYLLCLKSDPLARGKSLRLAQLKGRDYIDVVGKGEVWEQRKRDLKAAGVRDTGLEVANFGTMVGLIVAGFGVGLVPRMALPLCRRDELIEKPIKDPEFVRTFYLVKRRNRSLSLAAERMVRFIVETAARRSSTTTTTTTA